MPEFLCWKYIQQGGKWCNNVLLEEFNRTPAKKTKTKKGNRRKMCLNRKLEFLSTSIDDFSS